MDIKTTCLGVLMLGDASGYEIRKSFEEGPFSHFAEGGFGSIYPALTKLTKEGLVTCTAHQQEKRPAKKVYHITDAGWSHLEAAMREKIPSALPILDHMAECGTQFEKTMGRSLVLGFGMAVYQASLDYLVANREAFIAVAGYAKSPLSSAAE